MGGKLTCHLNSKEHRYISEHIADIMETLAPLYRCHLSSNLLTHMRNKHMEPSEPRPLIQHPKVVAHGGFVLEGTLPQYMDGIWTHRHLLVTNSFTVESRESKQVFEGGWGCKTELVLSGCHICTSIQDHCELVADMCQHIKGKSGGKLACWDCPTAFPVFMQHPYSAPVCLATGSHQEQTRWANILRAATQHQSSALWCEDSPESRAFLDAVSSLKKLRGNCQTEVYPVGDWEEVLVSMVMEDVMSYLKEKVFPRIIAHHSRRRTAWIKVLTPLSGHGPDDARMWQCLDKLEMSSEGQTWLQETWGVHSGTWRPLLLKAQNALYEVVDMCAVMFRRLLSRYPCFSFNSSQLTAVLCRIKEKVVKHLDTELLALRSQLILEAVLQITLPAFTHGVGEQDLSRYYAMVNSEQALFIHPDTIFHSVLRDNLTSYIQSVMRHSLPQQFVPLPTSPRNPCSSSSSFSEPVYHKLLPPGDCQQNICQTSEGSTSGSETLTPSTVSDWDDTLADSENSVNHTPSLLDAEEYIHLIDP
ncbi:protein Niban 2-like isoform X5 [Sander lucioperca]|uniref:protein Niban 2-like isoform X5 n=1 Tax=Sander lucioperca TaxID=283035 RepID=UPI00125D20BC|nr:protein Niban 2-like isoform X5 [Sander lucioperca]